MKRKRKKKKKKRRRKKKKKKEEERLKDIKFFVNETSTVFLSLANLQARYKIKVAYEMKRDEMQW